jgi:hypothetical protein
MVTDRWTLVDAMIAELGALYSLEVEAAAFPNVYEAPVLADVRRAVVSATEAVTVLTGEAVSQEELALARAREALDSAMASAAAVRRLLDQARADRHRRS